MLLLDSWKYCAKIQSTGEIRKWNVTFSDVHAYVGFTEVYMRNSKCSRNYKLECDIVRFASSCSTR